MESHDQQIKKYLEILNDPVHTAYVRSYSVLPRGVAFKVLDIARVYIPTEEPEHGQGEPSTMTLKLERGNYKFEDGNQESVFLLVFPKPAADCDNRIFASLEALVPNARFDIWLHLKGLRIPDMWPIFNFTASRKQDEANVNGETPAAAMSIEELTSYPEGEAEGPGFDTQTL